MPLLTPEITVEHTRALLRQAAEGHATWKYIRSSDSVGLNEDRFFHKAIAKESAVPLFGRVEHDPKDPLGAHDFGRIRVDLRSGAITLNDSSSSLDLYDGNNIPIPLASSFLLDDEQAGLVHAEWVNAREHTFAVIIPVIQRAYPNVTMFWYRIPTEPFADPILYQPQGPQ